MSYLMTKFPGTELTGLLHHAVFGLAKVIEPALGEQVEAQGEPSEPVGKNAVVDIATGGVVADQRRRPFPGFAATSRVLVIEVSQRLAAGEPKSLEEKKRQQRCRNALRQIEAKSAKNAKPVSHYDRADTTSLNGYAFASSELLVRGAD